MFIIILLWIFNCYTIFLNQIMIGGVDVNGSPERNSTGDRRSTVAIEELRRAFELVEVSTPGFSDTFLRCIITHLQRGYVTMMICFILFYLFHFLPCSAL